MRSAGDESRSSGMQSRGLGDIGLSASERRRFVFAYDRRLAVSFLSMTYQLNI